MGENTGVLLQIFAGGDGKNDAVEMREQHLLLYHQGVNIDLGFLKNAPEFLVEKGSEFSLLLLYCLVLLESDS